MIGRIYTEVIGNLRSPEWAERLKEAEVEFLDLDQWVAQKSRFVATSRRGHAIAVALHQRCGLKEGDLLHFDPVRNFALAIHLLPSDVLVVSLDGLKALSAEEREATLFELGHAIGNQHWPALMHHGEIFLPLVADRKVMSAVLESHRFQGLSYQFRTGEEVIPHLSPSEIRSLFGAAEPSTKHHGHGE